MKRASDKGRAKPTRAGLYWYLRPEGGRWRLVYVTPVLESGKRFCYFVFKWHNGFSRKGTCFPLGSMGGRFSERLLSAPPVEVSRGQG
jgi:hypothetical protein